jgi:transposase
LNQGTLFAPFIFEGYSNQAVYETYIEKVLMPVLRPGMVLVIDNASFHKSSKIRQLIHSVDCEIFYLPPYSPDLNPIEHFWSAIKTLIRKAAFITKDFYKSAIQVLGDLCKP